MRALTLTQPWAGLVASGIKQIENRSRPVISRAHFGEPFAIHASREIDERVYDRIKEIAPELALSPNSITCTQLVSSTAPAWYRLSRITSAVIGVATIDKVFDGRWDAETITKHASTLSDSRGRPIGPDQVRWFFGPVGYVLRDARALDTPVPCRGARGFWSLLDDVARAVHDQISAATPLSHKKIRELRNSFPEVDDPDLALACDRALGLDPLDECDEAERTGIIETSEEICARAWNTRAKEHAGQNAQVRRRRARSTTR